MARGCWHHHLEVRGAHRPCKGSWSQGLPFPW
jgi:hypothetical protein